MSHRRSVSKMPARAAAQLAFLLPLSLTVSLALAPPGSAAQPASGTGSQAPAPAASAPTLNLAECLEWAHQRQPRLAVARASLAAAQDGKRALDALRVPTLLVPELPVRRRQAALGVTAAAAA